MAVQHIQSGKLSLIMPLLFILLYSSGFVGTKLGLLYAPPLVFLSIRFVITALVLLGIAVIIDAKWPATWRAVFHIAIAGIFLVGLFSVGVWISMAMGVPPAISALIIALQPLLVAMGSYFLLKHPVTVAQWCGLLIGLIGVGLVVGEQAHFNNTYLTAIMMSFLGLLGLAVGTLYQKKFCAHMNIFTGGVIQSAVSGIMSFILALCFEPFTIQWSDRFIFALFWMSIVVSIGAISLLYLLLRKGESHKVASLFYLVPVVTAVIAYGVFHTMLTPVAIIGMLIAMLGVGLVNIKFQWKRNRMGVCYE